MKKKKKKKASEPGKGMGQGERAEVGREWGRRREKESQREPWAGFLASWKWDLFNCTGPHTRKGADLI